MGKHSEKRDERVTPRQEEPQDIFSSPEMEKKLKKRRRPVLKAIVITLSVLLVLLIGAATTFYIVLDGALDSFGGKPVDEDKIAVDSSNSLPTVKNIALFGIDSRQNQDVSQDEDGEKLKGLSDSIIIMSVNTKTKSIKLISVMRDSAVKVDGSYRKINSAYSRGGAELAIHTLNSNFGLDITDYATVNFAGMA